MSRARAAIERRGWRILQGGTGAQALPARWRHVADSVVACSEQLTVEMARKRWPHVQRLVEERRALLLDLQRAALDQPGRECVRALVDATRESEALIVAFATRRATTVR